MVEYTLEIGKGKDVEDIKLDTYRGEITLDGVDEDALVNRIGCDVAARDLDLEQLIKALVKRHGVGELIAHLSDASSSQEVLNGVYEWCPDEMRDFSFERFASGDD